MTIGVVLKKVVINRHIFIINRHINNKFKSLPIVG